jgi:hypothetical protein
LTPASAGEHEDLDLLLCAAGVLSKSADVEVVGRLLGLEFKSEAVRALLVTIGAAQGHGLETAAMATAVPA